MRVALVIAVAVAVAVTNAASKDRDVSEVMEKRFENPEDPNECVEVRPLLKDLDVGYKMTRDKDGGVDLDELAFQYNYFIKDSRYAGLNLNATVMTGSNGRESGDGVSPGQKWLGYLDYNFTISRSDSSPKFFQKDYKLVFGVHSKDEKKTTYYEIKTINQNVGSCIAQVDPDEQDDDVQGEDEKQQEDKVVDKNPVDYITVQSYLKKQ